jgi:hypothetical protein
MYERVALPESLSRWIHERAQELSPTENLRLRTCRRIPFWWIPGNKWMQGLTLWNTIFITSHHCPIDVLNPRTLELFFHELVHVQQFRRNPLLFPLRYLLGYARHGYHGNPAEVEARERAARLTRMYFKDKESLYSSM